MARRRRLLVLSYIRTNSVVLLFNLPQRPTQRGAMRAKFCMLIVAFALSACGNVNDGSSSDQALVMVKGACEGSKGIYWADPSISVALEKAVNLDDKYIPHLEGFYYLSTLYPGESVSDPNDKAAIAYVSSWKAFCASVKERE